jgi:dTDP-4-dehydrorhamnose 3,5-epimerase
MLVSPTELPGVLLIEPVVFRDARGFFLETYQRDRYFDAGIEVDFVQDNHSGSYQGTLRGLHAQRDPAQGKLVRVIEGEIFDVAVDIRRGAPTFGRSVAVRLSAKNHHQLYLPPGFAHGFYVLTPVAQIVYKCTAPYRPEGEIVIRWNDPVLGIRWPIDPAVPLLLSTRDEAAPSLHDCWDQLPVLVREAEEEP